MQPPSNFPRAQQRQASRFTLTSQRAIRLAERWRCCYPLCPCCLSAPSNRSFFLPNVNRSEVEPTLNWTCLPHPTSLFRSHLIVLYQSWLTAPFGHAPLPRQTGSLPRSYSPCLLEPRIPFRPYPVVCFSDIPPFTAAPSLRLHFDIMSEFTSVCRFTQSAERRTANSSRLP